ncbi:MAG: ABC transporter ATP-binding protein/permease, partial [Gluconacetobacter diazotrophicus]|nr:ABC transporter ATP-binding protein/permease [Gluconacetobacter diazotrophicus]
MRDLGPVVRDAWRLLTPYFLRSGEKRFALGMLAGIVVLNIAQTELGVLYTFWNNLVFDSIQRKDEATFLRLFFGWLRTPGGWIMPGFLIFVVVFIALAVMTVLLTNYLQIRWRNWMFDDFTRRWLSDEAHYRLSVSADAEGVPTDNPDQRLSDDIAAFCGAGANAQGSDNTLDLAIGLMNAIVSLVSYIALLWVLSRGVTLFGAHVPGGLVWVALLFSIGSTALTFWLGKRLIPLYFMQQRYEADLRFGLIRIRENAEGIALHRGEGEERLGLLGAFAAVRGNFLGLLRRLMLVGGARVTYDQVAGVLPLLVIAPLYFTGKATLGVMMQVNQAFGAVQGSFSWFADNFTTLARWRATVGRLATFDRAIEAARTAGSGF